MWLPDVKTAHRTKHRRVWHCQSTTMICVQTPPAQIFQTVGFELRIINTKYVPVFVHRCAYVVIRSRIDTRTHIMYTPFFNVRNSRKLPGFKICTADRQLEHGFLVGWNHF